MNLETAMTVKIDENDWVGIGNRGCFGESAALTPDYKAEQERRNAEMRAALDETAQYIVATPDGCMTLAEACKRNNDLYAEEKRIKDILLPPNDKALRRVVPTPEFVAAEENPVDIMAETRRMLK
jgi:hypothetical protein